MIYCTSILIIKADIGTFWNFTSNGVVIKIKQNKTKITVKNVLARPKK